MRQARTSFQAWQQAESGSRQVAVARITALLFRARGWIGLQDAAWFSE